MSATKEHRPGRWIGPHRRLLGSAVGSALLLVLASCSDAPRRPDVVMIAIDTLRADRLSCYGYPRPTSPVIDSLASDGALFLDATAQSGWTRPSMVSMLTGRYITAYRTDIAEEETTLAEAFSGAGYRTLAVIANKSILAKAGFARGFDRYVAFDADWPIPRTVARDRLTPKVWDFVDGALEKDGSDRPPYFVYVHPFFPHAPYRELEELEEELPVLEAVPTQPEGWREAKLEELGPPAEERAEGDWLRSLRYVKRSRGRYDHEVRYTDAMVGRLLDGLERRGLLERAVVALVSDHGEGLWDRVTDRAPQSPDPTGVHDLFYMAHGAHLYKEAIRTPFVVKGVGVPPGTRVETPVENVDLFPTLAELAGIAVPADLDGYSLVELMNGGPPPPRDAVFSYVTHKASVREISSGLKLTVPGDALHSPYHALELFELESDPNERDNLADARPEEVERLRAKLEAWLADNPDHDDGPMGDEEREVLEGLGYTGVELDGAR